MKTRSDMQYTPYNNNIIVRQLEEPKKKGIVIPKSTEIEDQAVGEIVALPTDITDLKVGDIIIYDEFAGAFIPYEKDLLILNTKYILAIKK